MKSVPQEIIDKTTNCPYDFACLKDSNHEQCKKTDRKDYGLINIIPKTDADIDCNPYLVTFPQLKDSYCTCPVNNYIQTEITNMDWTRLQLLIMSSNEKRKEFAKIFPELPLDKLINKIETDTMAGEIIEIVEAENEVLSVRTDLNQTPAIELSPLLPFTLSKQLETI